MLALCDRQHDAQLLRRGLSRRAIDHRVDTGHGAGTAVLRFTAAGHRAIGRRAKVTLTGAGLTRSVTLKR